MRFPSGCMSRVVVSRSPVARPWSGKLRLFILCIPLAYLFCGTPARAASDGWTPQTYRTTRAISGCALTSAMAHSGSRSLALDIRLNGSDAARREGEAFVDLRYHAPAGEHAPLDLSGQTVTAWFYCPPGLEGIRHNPNGVRIFVKDTRWKSEYGAWTHMVPGKWIQLTLSPAPDAPPTGFRNPYFDPHHIIVVGVSVAAGGGSNARFLGEAAIDDIAWGDASSPKYGFEP